MKKLLLTIVGSALVSMAANAQYYDFSVSSGTYSPITGTTISDTEWDDEAYTVIPTYDVILFGEVVDSFAITDYGFNIYAGGSTLGYFLPCAGDLVSLGSNESPIKWTETGTTPNRILKVEFANAGTFNDQDGTPSDTINYQVWFLENNNSIEIHYGESIVVQDGDDPWDGFDGPVVGTLLNNAGGILMSGSSSSPTLNTIVFNNPQNYSVTGMPSNGTVYIFTPRKFQVSLPIIADAVSFSAYPNPFNNSLTITSNKTANITLTDINGRVIDTFTVNDKYELNTAHLAQGVYFLQSSNGAVMKIIK